MKKFLGTAALVLIGFVAWNIYKGIKKEAEADVAEKADTMNPDQSPELQTTGMSHE